LSKPQHTTRSNA